MDEVYLQIDRHGVADGSSTYTNKRWNVSGGASWLGIFGGKGGAESTSTHQEFTSKLSTDEFGPAFEITKIPFVRSWLPLAFLNSQTWRFDPGNPELKGDLLSDGGAPPKGLMAAIPMEMVVVQNLELKLGHSELFQNFVRDTKNASQGGDGYVRFGPFFLGGGGKNMSSTELSTRDWEFKSTEQGMFVPGMQIAGFQCYVFDEARPAPLAQHHRMGLRRPGDGLAPSARADDQSLQSVR